MPLWRLILELCSFTYFNNIELALLCVLLPLMIFIYVFTLLSISNSLFVISLSALRVGELGKRSINDFPSSNDCARLGSSGMEPKI